MIINIERKIVNIERKISNTKRGIVNIINKLNRIFLLSLFFFCLQHHPLYAYTRKYCEDNRLGWHFYCEDEPLQTTPTPLNREKPKDSNQKDKDNSQTKKDNQENKQPNNKQSYTQQLKELQEMVEETKAKAVLEPTEQNLEEYMRLQMKLLNQASLFSDVWRRVLWVTPELDYTQQRPVSSVGKQVWSADRENREINTLKNINKRYGIFFIYSSTCSYCQRYSQILYDLKQQYKVEIIGISIDGNFLPLWETNSFVNTGQLEQLNIDYSTVPVTILYDNLTNSTISIGYGLMTQDELINRIYVITQTKPGEDY
jgi:conjugal transfer pilus assembly protein TraF